MNNSFNSTKVITGVNTRWSYCNVWEPKSINGGTPKYSVSLIIPKTDTTLLEKNRFDIEECERKFNDWWLKIGQKYELIADPDGRWQIDFKTNIIYLVKP